MSEIRKIRDPIHGFITLTPKEFEIVDSPLFQRLRGIKQLAFAHLVYPGALHSRFEHSLGVFHISSLLTKSLYLEKEDVENVCLAALIHDIGHGPFSHVSEEALEIYCDKEKIEKRLKGDREKIHELITEDIILNSQLCDIIGKRGCEIIAKLLSSGYGDPALKSIVSGPIDADKQDYLLRDSYYCGVKYGVFDLHQLHKEFATIVDLSGEGKRLGISVDGVIALEQFVLAKYYITTQVYRHKIRLITDQMLIRAICLGIDYDKIEELYKLYNYDGSYDFIDNYINWDDARFLLYFTEAKFKGKKCYDIIMRLIERRLFKRIFRIRITDLPDRCRDPLIRITEPDYREKRNTIEKLIGGIISDIIKQKIITESVILHYYKIKSVYDRNDEPILVNAKQKPKHFDQESLIFRSIDKQMSESFVEVYAPVE